MRAGRRNVRISNPDKLLFPDDGITKRDLAAYYAAVAPAMVPHVRDRPLNLWRWNAGIQGDVVVQQAIPKGAPEWVKRIEVRAPARRVGRARGRRRGRDARVAREPELHHAARVDGPRRPARVSRPARVRPRPARRGPGLALPGDPRRRARARRGAARARAAAVRDDVGLARAARRRRRCAGARMPTRRARRRARSPSRSPSAAPTSSRPRGARRSAAAACSSTWPATRTRRPRSRPTRSARCPARRSPRRSPGRSSRTPELHPRRWTLASVPERLERGGDPWEGIAADARALPRT